MQGKTILKLLLALLAVYLLVLILGCVVVPLQHKRVTENQRSAVATAMESKKQEERLLCIDDNAQALLWRLRLIEAAQEEIAFSTFDFGDDESAQDMMSALLAAAERGVQIRLLVDGVNGILKLPNNKQFHALITQPNVEARYYNKPHPIKTWTLNYRMHDKILLIDDRLYILGGRNTNNLFLGDYAESYNIDRDILVYEETPGRDSSLQDVRAYYDALWALESNQPIKPKRSADETIPAMQAHYAALKTRYPEAFVTVDWEEETMSVAGVTLLTNPIEAVNKRPLLWYAANRYMEQGSDILVQTPYIICDKNMYADLTALSQGGRRVQIMLNAVEGGANPFGCTDYLNQKQKILNTGVEVYEWLGGQSLHTKTILIDDRISIVGSMNFDMRSVYLDTETMLVIDSPELNATLREAAARDMEYSAHILPDGTVTNGAHYASQGFSTVQKGVYTVLRVITRPFRHIL